MRSTTQLLLAAILTIQFSSSTTFAREVGPEVCSHCVGDDKVVGDTVNWDGEVWRLDRVTVERGQKMWDAHVIGKVGSEVGEGKSFGNDGKDLGNERITGRDFGSFEDSKDYSKEKRQKLYEIQQKIIARLNSESVADSDATTKELQSQIGSLNDAVRDAGELSLQGPGIPNEMVDPMFSLYDTLQVKMGPDGFYPDKGGWRLEDHHSYQSDHKDQLEDLKSRLNSHVPTSPQQADAKRAGYYVIDQADKAYSANQPQLGEGLFEIAKVVVDIATDIIPVTSIPKDLYRAVVGKDPMTGESLAGWERALAGGFAVGGIFGLGAVKVGVSRIRAMARAARVTENDIALAAKVAKSAEGFPESKSLVLKLKNSLTNPRLLDPVKENKLLIKNRNYTELAWNERKVVLAGKTANEQKFVRFFSTSKTGSWVVDAKSVAGKSPEEIREILALTEVPTHYTEVTVPAGTEIYSGFVGKNINGGDEKVVQHFLPVAPDSFFVKTNLIGDTFRGTK